MQPTRVAYLIYSVGLGGGELLLVNHLAHANREAFDPLVVCSEEGPLPDRLRSLSVPVFTLPIHKQANILGRLNVPTPSTVLRLARLLRRERVRLIHSYTLETIDYAHAVAVLTGCPLIHTSQETWSGDTFNRIQWWVMNRVPARIIVISETVRQSLHVGTDLAPARVVRIFPGIDLCRFAPRDERAAVRTEFGLQPDTSLIGFVGRLSSVKGPEVFLAAAALIARRLPAARFLVVGGAVLRHDDYGEEVSRVIQEHGLQQHVILTGFRDDVPRLISALDVLVSSSPQESCGLVLMEAAACGRPVVATRSGGSEEIVVDGETGLLVPVGDPPAMAGAIVTLLSDPTRAEALGQAARQRAENRFDLRRMVGQVEMEYRTVLAEHAGRIGEGNFRARMGIIS